MPTRRPSVPASPVPASMATPSNAIGAINVPMIASPRPVIRTNLSKTRSVRDPAAIRHRPLSGSLSHRRAATSEISTSRPAAAMNVTMSTTVSRAMPPRPASTAPAEASVDPLKT